MTVATSMNAHTTLSSTVNGGTTNTTLMVEGEISIPAYAELEYGLDYRVKQGQIGFGGFGTIQLVDPLQARLLKLDFPLVAKEFDQKYSDKPFYQEVALMAKLTKTPGFATFVGYSHVPKVIVMKYYPLGALKGFIDGKTGFKYSMLILMDVLIMISKAIEFLHLNDICHNDINPENVLLELVDGRLVAVLTDFGISTIGKNATTVAGFNPINLRGLTIAFAAPELFYELRKLKSVVSRTPCDVYAMGSLMFSMLNRKVPWSR